MFGRGHVEMKNRMFRPFLLHLARFQTLEKILPTLEIVMESRRQQRLAEPARPAQENVLILIGNLINISSFVNIQIITLNDFIKCLYPNRESSDRRLHSPKLYTFPKIAIFMITFCFCAALKKDSQHYFPFPEIITIFAPHFESKTDS